MSRTSYLGILARRPSMILLLTLVASTVSPTQAFGLLPRSSDSCPTNYDHCASSLPSSFCCPSTSSCISLDDNSSAICCPEGESCDYIEPITCDVQLQNATSHPKNSVKTTRLDDSLPKCGDSCCPFGYTCTGDSICAMNTASASTATASQSSTTGSTATNTLSNTFATSASTTTNDPSDPTIIETSDPRVTSASKTAISDSTTSTHNSSAAALSAKTASCPSYPSSAIAAGFFPGAIFGAVLALLCVFFHRRRQRKNLPPSAKLAQFTRRSTKGTLIGISSPIPSEETSYRTDFLLRRSRSKRSSRFQRTGTRVKSLFLSNNTSTSNTSSTSSTSSTNNTNKNPQNTVTRSFSQRSLVPDRGARVPVPVPPLPISVTPLQPNRSLSKKGLARTESIRIYTPPGVFATTGVLDPDPYPTHIRTEGVFDSMEK
ncbi:hypothetical protein BO70DRAFT_358691 [Aspergillus heteromorphus CBS 117.55]|uniref:GPI transamidase component PIG-S n=1 Tax=Aspergillus heteromorphus CBS 117.55 TaxID=1448321 RepID=A0A317WXW1_9EURO|nr:uncharacterized protein BO70DRAFT_358691 [Aspergillus heteromorphus CBS 117.55]PWY91244.1 hypothetical protein BO70DRAFT_358691 [Aspergillus heteromorphus CBS 117.55]